MQKKIVNPENRRLDTKDKASSSKKSGRQGKAAKEEKAQRESDYRTQGRAGCKLPRINLACSPENYDFVHVMSKLSGRSIGQYVNFVITQYREEHPGLFEEAQAVLEKAEGSKEGEK